MNTPTPDQLITPSLRLIRRLGEGGMGAVWIAEHLGLRANVVVKFMSPELAATDEGKARFSKEAASSAQVRSPHVAQTLDYGVTNDNLPYIVMEQLDGHDLEQEIAMRGKIPADEVVSIVAQLARALSRVHACGIIHRDIKPSNIFLCDAGDGAIFVKLLDFGVAKMHRQGGLGNSTNTGAMIGTPYYMSPEQLMGEKEIDHRSDLWAVAVVAFEALTGRKPFKGDTVSALAVRILRDPLPVPSLIEPSLAQGFDQWFARACARDGKDRFADAKHMAEELTAAFASNAEVSESQQGSPAVVATSAQTPASADEAFAPTGIDTSSPGVFVKSEAAAQATARQSLISTPRLIGLAVGVALGGVALWIVVPRFLHDSATAPASDELAARSAQPSADEATEPVVPSATGPILSAPPVTGSSAHPEIRPPPVSTVQTVGRATASAPPESAPESTSTTAPGTDDDIW